MATMKRIRQLQRALELTTFCEGDDVKQHLNELYDIRDEMKDLGHHVSDAEMVQVLLASVPDFGEFGKMKAVLRYAEESKLSNPDAVAMAIRRAAEVETAARNTRKNRGCFACGSKYHVKAECPSDSRGSKRQKRLPQVEEYEESESVVLPTETAPHSQTRDDCWTISIATTVHMTGDVDYFVHLEDAKVTGNEHVHGAPLTPGSVAGKGRVVLVTQISGREQSVVLDDVYYVPGAPYSVFSPAAAQDQGLTVDLDFQRGISVRKKGELLFRTGPGKDAHRFYAKSADGTVLVDNRRGVTLTANLNEPSPRYLAGNTAPHPVTGDDFWCFSSATSGHVVGNLDYFLNLRDVDLGDRQLLVHCFEIEPDRIVGMGTIALVMQMNGKETTVLVDDVFYVPGTPYGVFSPGRASDQGMRVFSEEINGKHWMGVKKRGKVLIRATSSEDHAYGFYAKPLEGIVLMDTRRDQTRY
ncbi:hypothetical protein Poli38472_014363 [Pythium oligandrum]|uniref:Retrovirus-related Pol polyprotein from transposon TNT 1-94-like beta-barrel domain-containing protein n=1 Tax=Pythium oligandrum TaxID=41045 RepID=A0A8K1C7A5_PYTOL|nr:hypothetical protein Poli38472_014363 [Pythium oligandrum]|eukprot:TMW57760.1 hypothetical protein Poli38472_014363 [Pythium oligandrum]